MILDPLIKAINSINRAALVRRCNVALKELDKLKECIEWQPMETAPHDGTEILLLLSNDWVIIASDREDPYFSHYRWWRSRASVNVPVIDTHPKNETFSLIALKWRRIRFPNDIDGIDIRDQNPHYKKSL